MRLSQKIKVRIAKEILIFFSSIVLTLFIWIFFYTRNIYIINQTENIKEDEKSLNTTIDSFEREFPGIRNFDGKLFEKRVFKVDNLPPVAISTKGITEFLKANPSANEVLIFEANNGTIGATDDTLGIPLNEVIEFLNDVPDAKLIYSKISKETWHEYKIIRQQRDNQSNEIVKKQQNLYKADQLKKFTAWFGFIIFLIIYPIRAIILTLVWSYRTIKKD